MRRPKKSDFQDQESGQNTAQPPTAAPTATEPPEPAKPAATSPPPRPLSKAITENTQFLSSVVIGGAGLIATSIYQCNNSKLAQRQAEWQQKRELEKAQNDWRIERAKILAQNLQTLTARGGDTAEQRFGVLLSLTRGNILDSDLAVSYALELGRDSPEYMRSVLVNVDRKDIQHYQRLASAYLPTCTQRYGVSVPSLPICKDDAMDARSQAIAEVVGDDLETALADPMPAGPLELLSDERSVNSNLLRMTGIFSEFIGELYDRRQWATLDRFLGFSQGARLVGTLNLLMQSGDPIPTTDQEATKQRFEEGRAWLESYVTSPTCDSECRGRVLSVILSNISHGQPQFVKLLRALFGRPRPESLPFLNRLHSRLSLCQIGPKDTLILRDEVLLPVLFTQTGQPKPDQEMIDDLLYQLLLLPPIPDASADWKLLQGALQRVTKGRQPKLYFDRLQEEQNRRKALLQQGPPSASQAAGTKAPAAPAPTHVHRDFCAFANQFKEDHDDSEE